MSALKNQSYPMSFPLVYYLRQLKRTYLCHYFNAFPRPLEKDIIEAHRDQEDQFIAQMSVETQKETQKIFTEKARRRLNFIDGDGGMCLEIGSESGWFGDWVREKMPASKYIGIDFRFEVLNGNSRSDHLMICGDGAAIPLKNASVDIFLAYHVLEHIRNLSHFKEELHRVLKKGAQIHFAVPLGYDEDPCHRWHFMTGKGWKRFIRRTLDLQPLEDLVDNAPPSEYISSWQKI